MTAPRLETAHAGGCVKIAYPSRAHALLDMDRIARTQRNAHGEAKRGKLGRVHRRKNRQHTRPVCRAYECRQCGAWHLTSQAAK